MGFNSKLPLLGIDSSSADNKKGKTHYYHIGEYVESKFLHGVRDHGIVINTSITLAAAKAITVAKDSNLLIANGGTLTSLKNEHKS